MLPEALSANWLSLVPGEDRCCLTVELRVDPEGRITATDVYESLIRSRAKLSYAEVAAYLDRGEVSSALEPVRRVLPWFRTAAARIAMARARRGGVEVARDETRIVFDTQTGAPSGIESLTPTSAHAMIERFMVAANEAVAVWLVDRGVPGVFRVHDQPGSQEVTELSHAAHHFGFEAGFGKSLTPLALAAFDHQISGAACEPALRSVLLRSLGPARYTVFPDQHFGLAAPLYLHFTSPIRRYADLAVHRTIKQYLRGHRDFVTEDPEVERLAMHINFRARVASRAENDRRRILVARLMADHVGEVHDAHITRVRPFGLVAQIDATLVDGVVPLETLPGGPYRPDARETAVVGTDRTFAVGMPIRVRVVSTDPMLGRVELGWVEDADGPGP
jgi:ribonuclease R